MSWSAQDKLNEVEVELRFYTRVIEYIDSGDVPEKHLSRICVYKRRIAILQAIADDYRRAITDQNQTNRKLFP